MIIYKATNLINGKIYIGKTINSLQKRISQHYGSINRKNKTVFINALKKYGKENFKWDVLCEIDNENMLNALEKFYIATYRKMYVLYNMSEGGEDTRKINGYKISEETRKKMSDAKKGKVTWVKGRKHSEETKEKLRQINKGKYAKEKHPFWGKHLTNEHKLKISHAEKGKPKNFTKEGREKISNTHKGKKHSKEWCSNISKGQIGKKLSVEHKEKIRQIMLEKWKNKEYKNHMIEVHKKNG